MNVNELLKWQCETYNALEGHLNDEDGIECDICHNKGSIQFVRMGYGNQLCLTEKDCACMRKRNAFRRAKASGMGEYLNKKLSDYIASEPWQKTCKNRIEEYMDKHSADNTWLMACGTSGSGKTLLCSIVANHLLMNCDRVVMYITWTDFISRLKRDMMGDKTNAVSEYIEDVKNTDVLFLDEVIKKYNESDLKYLIEIINYRYTNNLKTIITSEKVIDELLDIDEATFGRVIEKSDVYVINIPKDRKKNYRLRALMNT